MTTQIPACPHLLPAMMKWHQITTLRIWMTDIKIQKWFSTESGPLALQLRHNGQDGISNYQSLNCLFLVRHRSKKTSKLHVTGLCEGNPLMTGGFPSQREMWKMFSFDDVIMESSFQYHQTFNIRLIKSQNLNVFDLILQLSLPNPLEPGVKLRMKMQLEQCWQAMLQLHLSCQWCSNYIWVINKFIAY